MWDKDWNPTVVSAVIIEWKVRREGRAKLSRYDLDWQRKWIRHKTGTKSLLESRE